MSNLLGNAIVLGSLAVIVFMAVRSLCRANKEGGGCCGNCGECKHCHGKS